MAPSKNGARMKQLKELQSAVRGALEPFESIAFSLLFGSAVADRLRSDSDLDVAVYGFSGRRRSYALPPSRRVSRCWSGTNPYTHATSWR